MDTILMLTAPVAGLAALIGLWHSQKTGSRGTWRVIAMVTALGATTLMALIALPDANDIGAFLAANGSLAAVFYGLGLWFAMSALLVDEYRRNNAVSETGLSPLSDGVIRELSSTESLDTVLMNIAALFRVDAAASFAHVYKISMNRRQAFRTGTVSARYSVTAASVHEDGGLLNELAWWGAQEHAIVRADGAVSPVITVPLHDGQTTYAIILIENPQRQPGSDWHGLATLIGQRIADWGELASYRPSGIVAKRLHAVMPQLMSADRIEPALSLVDRVISGLVEYDYLSLSSLGVSRAHEDRVTMMSGSDRVMESRHRWPIAGAAAHRVISTGRSVITPDLDMSTDDEKTDHIPWERRLGMRSRMIVPIIDGARVIGTVTLAHRRYARYDEHDIELVAIVCATLSLWMRQIDSVRREARTGRALAFLRNLERNVLDSADESTVVADASGVVDATGMRVYRLDEDSQSLVEVAASGRLPRINQESRIPLTKLPWHRWAIESKRTLMVNQADPESVMSTDEATLAMDQRMKTGCLVPIVANDRSLGVIDVVEQRHPDRNALDSGSKLVVESLATSLAQRWAGSDAVARSDEHAIALNDRLKAWSRQVVNPLTSIIGSVELIRYKEAGLNSESIKYLSTIERSATKVHESLMTILAEMAAQAGESPILTSNGRWYSVRPAERAAIPESDFARPASLSEAVMKRAGDTMTSHTINYSEVGSTVE